MESIDERLEKERKDFEYKTELIDIGSVLIICGALVLFWFDYFIVAMILNGIGIAVISNTAKCKGYIEGYREGMDMCSEIWQKNLDLQVKQAKKEEKVNDLYD